MKRIICLIIVVISLSCMLTSCSTFGEDPMAYSKELREKGFYVEVYRDSNLDGMLEILDIAEEFEIEDYSSWIDYVVFCENEEEGYFFYCYDNKSAKNIEKALKELTEKYKGYAECVIKRQGKIVYIGWEENWSEI